MNSAKLAELLVMEMAHLQRSAASLERSLARCVSLTPSPCQSFEDEESFDALTSKFARTADILTQKVLKTLVMLLREDAPTFIDRMNLCEKLGVVPSAGGLVEVRDLRNTIAHEYAAEDLLEIYADTVRLCPMLLAAVDSSCRFAKECLAR
jgi:hypothetical protein